MATQNSELIHAMVIREMQEGVIRDGLWAQALVEATYDKEKAKAIYIRLRAANMQEDTKKLLVKQIQQALKSDEVKRKDFTSASGLKKPRCSSAQLLQAAGFNNFNPIAVRVFDKGDVFHLALLGAFDIDHFVVVKPLDGSV